MRAHTRTHTPPAPRLCQLTSAEQPLALARAYAWGGWGTVQLSEAEQPALVLVVHDDEVKAAKVMTAEVLKSTRASLRT